MIYPLRTISSLIAAVCGTVFFATSVHAACPAWDRQEARVADLSSKLSVAPDLASSIPLNSELWGIWLNAPDETAQELLDIGMRARRVADYDKAEAAFDTLIDYCPDYAEGYNQRAFVHFLREDYAPALTDLEKTLQITPDHIGAKSGMALTLLRMGRMRQGQVALREALAMHPWLPERSYLVEVPQDADGQDPATDN